MTRGIYSELDRFGGNLAQQTGVTVYSAQDNLIRFQLNDRTNNEGNREYIAYNKEVDAELTDQDVVAEIVEGDKNQWESLLEPDTSSKLSSLTNTYSIEEIDGDSYIVASDSTDTTEDYGRNSAKV